VKEEKNIFRKSKGQIVIDGLVKLTDEEGNEISHGDDLPFVASENLRSCLL
jgi:hypothetical protein|tara:strand:- start:43 stop:195 length:153 start_codon:yes stop_codon:yes gene_type:complete